MMRRKRWVGLILGLLFFPVLGLIQQLFSSSSSYPDLSQAIEKIQSEQLTEGSASFCLGGPEFMAALAGDTLESVEKTIIGVWGDQASFEGLEPEHTIEKIEHLGQVIT